MLAPGGRLIVVDLAAHDRAALAGRLAHRWPGFTDIEMTDLLASAGVHASARHTVPGPLDVRLWLATTSDQAASATHADALLNEDA